MPLKHLFFSSQGKREQVLLRAVVHGGVRKQRPVRAGGGCAARTRGAAETPAVAQGGGAATLRGVHSTALQQLSAHTICRLARGGGGGEVREPKFSCHVYY